MKKFLFSLFSVAIIFCLTSPVVSAEMQKSKKDKGGLTGVIKVNAGDDLQAVIDASGKGADIRCAAGATFKNIRVKSEITISGGWNADFTAQDGELTILDGEKANQVVVVPNKTKNCVIRKMKIQNGFSRDGAGVNVLGDITLDGCVIVDNIAEHRGGGIGTDERENQGKNVNLVIVNCIIDNNGAKEHGGGVAVEEGTAATIVNCLFTRNYNYVQRDGWYTALVCYHDCTLINNTFTRNIGEDVANGECWPLIGVRILPFGGDLVAVNNIIAGNFAKARDRADKGLYRQEFQLELDTEWSETNVIAGNIIEGGIRSTNPTTPKNIKAGMGNQIVATTYDMSKLFTDWENGDFTIIKGSPAAEKGIVNPEVAEILNKYTTDLLGNPRLVGAKIDVGCYEIQ